MPCYQSTNLPGGVTTTGRTSYATQADCNQACREGACCEGTTCTVKPQCQCQGAGKVFKGVGTVCSPNPCTHLCSAACAAPAEVHIQLSIENAVRVPGNILGYQTDDPYSSLLPLWARDCMDALPSALSGNYVLRYKGLGPVWSQYAGVPEYTFSNSSISLNFLWWCDSFGNSLLKGQLFRNDVALTGINGHLDIGTPRNGCVFDGGGQKGLSGTTILQSCSSTSISLVTQNNLTIYDGLFVRFVKYFDSSNQIVGGLSGIKFPITATIS